LAHNLAYASTLPGERPHTNAPMPIVRGVSATKMAAFYDDEAADDFARFAMWGELQRPKDADPFIAVRIYDEDWTYFLSCKTDGSAMTYLDRRRHGVGVTPIHRFSPRLDLEGRATGEIEPFLPLLHRLDQDVFDRLIVQRFNSWKVRYVAGMTQPRTDAEKRAASLALRVEDLLVSESKDTKFGTLDSTDIKQYIEAHDADVRDLAATSQTPPHHLLGQMANLSAEALESAEKSLMRKVQEYRDSFAQTWDSVLRSCAFIMAEHASPAERAAFEQEAIDYEMAIKWKESDDRALAPVADSLSKLADSLGIPYEMLWEQLPFWKKGDTERAKDLIAAAGDQALLMQFMDAMEGEDQGADSGNGPAD
ncbi:MAG TPA: phage portal protein, partial [Glycomyces sp.]|nr:phage portal protein [Glycomyces sp.]